MNVCNKNQSDFLDLYVDHGLLVTKILNGRELSSTLIVGSVPPPNDTVWDRAREHGCEVITYPRNASNKEKKVDSQLICSAMRSIFTQNQGILVLVAGDGDYCPLIMNAQQENWKIETWFWSEDVKILLCLIYVGT